MAESCNQSCGDCDFDDNTSSNPSRKIDAILDTLSTHPTKNPEKEDPLAGIEGGFEKLESIKMRASLEKHFLNSTVSKLCQQPIDVCSSSSSSGETNERAETRTTFTYQYERRGRLYKAYNIEPRKSSDDSSSVSYCRILDRDSECRTADGNPRPLKRKKLDDSTRSANIVAFDGNQKDKPRREIDIFEVERRMLNDRLFHRYFEYNKIRGTPIWMAFEPVNNEPYSSPVVRSDSMNTLKGSIQRSSIAIEVPHNQTSDKPSAVQELRKRFENFQSGKPSGDSKSEKEGLQDLLNRAAAEFTGNFEDLDPELIEQGKKYLKSKGVTLGDLISVAGRNKFSLKAMVTVMKLVLFDKIFRRSNMIALGVSALLGILVITISASRADQLWQKLIVTKVF